MTRSCSFITGFYSFSLVTKINGLQYHRLTLFSFSTLITYMLQCRCMYFFSKSYFHPSLHGSGLPCVNEHPPPPQLLTLPQPVPATSADTSPPSLLAAVMALRVIGPTELLSCSATTRVDAHLPEIELRKELPYVIIRKEMSVERFDIHCTYMYRCVVSLCKLILPHPT